MMMMMMIMMTVWWMTTYQLPQLITTMKSKATLISIPYTPYTKIRGNAGIEECFYIDAVNRELLLHRRFFFLFNDREALMNALGHMLYDDKELIEEFFVNDETKNRFLVTKSNVPDHKVVLSVDDMDVDVDVYEAYDIDECYKVESQVC